MHRMTIRAAFLSLIAAASGLGVPVNVEAAATLRPNGLAFQTKGGLVNTLKTVGGPTVDAVVFLTEPAPAGGLIVQLSADSESVRMPSGVTVLAGQMQQGFRIMTAPVATSTAVTIAAQQGLNAQKVSLHLEPPSLSGLALKVPAAVGGTRVDGTVTLNGAAPSTGTPVALRANTTAVTAPPRVVVAAGATTGAFAITTQPVASDTTAVITAEDGSSGKTAQLFIKAPTLTSLTVSSASVAGGTPVTGSVSLTGPAPTQGITVALSSSHTAASVPSSIVIPDGETAATFTVTTQLPSSDTSVTIVAGDPASPKTAQFTITALAIASVLVPSSVQGPSQVGGSLTLASAAPAGGLAVPLTSSHPSYAVMPASVTVPAGNTTANFNFNVTSVPEDTNLIITAGEGTSAKTGQMLIKAPVVSALSTGSAALVGGETTLINVGINAAAPAGGMTISMASSDSTIAVVPATVTIPAASRSTSFTMTTQPVSADTNVTLTATVGNTPKTTQLTIKAPSVASVNLNSTATSGGGSLGASVAMTGRAAADLAIPLGSSDTTRATVPATVTIPAGQTSATFTITTQPVAADTSVTISAGVAPGQRTAQLTIRSISVTAVTLAGETVGGSLLDGAITLNNPAPEGGLAVPLASTNATSASVPASINVLSGQRTGFFTVTTQPVASETNVTISAGEPGTAQTAQLTVKPPTLSAVNMNAPDTVGGTTITGTVTLTGRAPTSGFEVPMTSNSSRASLRLPVRVGVGLNTGTFTVDTTPVSADTTVTISAGPESAPKTASFTVRPPAVTSVTFANGHVVKGGEAITGTVSIGSTAPSGGFQVPIASGEPNIAAAPATATIPQGQTTGTFEVTSTPVTADVNVTITAGSGPGAKYTQVRVKAPTTITSLTASPTSIKGDGSATVGLSVGLSSDVPPGGMAIPVTSSHPDVLAFSSFSIPAGSYASMIWGVPKRVGSDTQVTITAGSGEGAKTAIVTVQAPELTRLSVVGMRGVYDPVRNQYVQVEGTAVGGRESVNVNAFLDISPPPQGMTVELSSDDPAIAVPPTITIPAGAGNGAVIVDTMSVGSDVPVTITARLNSVVKTATVTLKPIGLESVKLTAFEGGSASVVNGGKTAVVAVRLNADAPAGGITIPLTSSHPEIFPVPSSLTVSLNSMGQAHTLATALVTEDTPVTVTAGTGANATTATITVRALGVQTLSVSFQSVTGGSPITGSIMLNDKAPAGGFTVPLSSNIPEATVPGSVTVPANQYTASFEITTSAVTANKTGTITAGVGSTAKTVNVLLRP